MEGNIQLNSRMTPQQLNAAVKRYEEIVADPATTQEAFLTAVKAVKAARTTYESVPATVYPLGTFVVQCGQMVVVDTFGTAETAVLLPGTKNGIWHAFVGVEAGIHVALFAYYEMMTPVSLNTAYVLIKQASWEKAGAVGIDTASCAIADRDAYVPLEVEESGYHIAGIEAHLCFSNTANADGHYPVFTQTADGVVTAVYTQFADVANRLSATGLFTGDSDGV